MKVIGVLFDVSSSMKEKLENINGVNEINKKSDELIEILNNICKNSEANIFTILYGLYDSPYIADFIKLLQISNHKFKELKSTDKDNSQFYRNKIIKLLSTDENGEIRYCNIKDYVLSPNGPSEKLSEFLCNLMEEERKINDNIYYNLPIEVRSKNENNKMKIKTNGVKFGGSMGILGGCLLGAFLVNPITMPFGIMLGCGYYLGTEKKIKIQKKKRQ